MRLPLPRLKPLLAPLALCLLGAGSVSASAAAINWQAQALTGPGLTRVQVYDANRLGQFAGTASGSDGKPVAITGDLNGPVRPTSMGSAATSAQRINDQGDVVVQRPMVGNVAHMAVVAADGTVRGQTTVGQSLNSSYLHLNERGDAAGHSQEVGTGQSAVLVQANGTVQHLRLPGSRGRGAAWASL
jgi:hypothetical protein